MGEQPVGPVRLPLRLVTATDAKPGRGTLGLLLERMREGAFQGRRLGEAFAAWKRMIEGPGLICLGLAGSMASAGLWPLVAWLVDRGYVDVLASTSANVTEDVLEARGARFLRVEPEHVDDAALWGTRHYRFYDHVVSADDYDAMEDFLGQFFEDLAGRWPAPAIPGARFMYELGRWLEARGLGATVAATCARAGVPLFVPAAPDGPLAEGYRVARRRGPVVDFFADYEIALGIVEGWMTPARGTGAIYLGGGVPKDFLQIIATSVCALRGSGEASPYGTAIQITTDNAVYGGLSGASVASECISWGKEAPGGTNVMVFADVTIALPLLCQALLEHFGEAHRRRLPPDERPIERVLAGGATTP